MLHFFITPMEWHRESRACPKWYLVFLLQLKYSALEVMTDIHIKTSLSHNGRGEKW